MEGVKGWCEDLTNCAKTLLELTRPLVLKALTLRDCYCGGGAGSKQNLTKGPSEIGWLKLKLTAEIVEDPGITS